MSKPHHAHAASLAPANDAQARPPAGAHVSSADDGAPVSQRRPSQLSLADGSVAALEGPADGQQMTLRDPAGRLLFAYRPGDGRMVLAAPDGDLELAAPRGDVRVRAGGSLRCEAGRDVTLEVADPGQEDAGLASRTRLSLGKRALSLSSRSLELASQRAELLLGETRYRGVRMDVALEQVDAVVGRIESVVERAITRAKDVFARVEGLSQLHAGRRRTVVEGASVQRAGRMDILADGDVRVDGEQILLG